MNEFTHEIIRMERSTTKNSASPMWRCTTTSGEKVNVFSHNDPAKDNTLLFRQAGYWLDMEALKVGESLEWTQHPIRVAMRQVGGWWTIDGVQSREDGATPDTRWTPNPELYRLRAQRQASTILGIRPLRFIDLETTGLNADDEICAIAILDHLGESLMDVRVRPRDPSKLLRPGKNGKTASDVNGIRPEDFGSEPRFGELYSEISEYLNGTVWVIYNAKFDIPMLDRECNNAGVQLFAHSGAFDAAQIAAEYLGNWNEKRQWFEMLTLEDAGLELVGGIGELHNATNDAQTTFLMLESIARGDKRLTQRGDVPF